MPRGADLVCDRLACGNNQ